MALHRLEEPSPPHYHVSSPSEIARGFITSRCTYFTRIFFGYRGHSTVSPSVAGGDYRAPHNPTAAVGKLPLPQNPKRFSILSPASCAWAGPSYASRGWIQNGARPSPSDWLSVSRQYLSLRPLIFPKTRGAEACKSRLRSWGARWPDVRIRQFG